MGCCVGCQSGMGCCDDYSLAGLYGLSGLNGLMGELATGSRVRVGLEFEFSHAYDPDETEAMGAGPIQNLFYDQFGPPTFKDTRVTVQMPTFWSDGYVTVEATSMTPLPYASVFGQMVENAFKSYLPRYIWEKTHETLVDYAPPTPNAQPAGPPQICDLSQLGLQEYFDCQLGRGRWAKQQTQNQNQPGQPSKCAGMSPGDWIACQLGITPTAGIAAGAIGSLVLVGGVLALVVFLKR
jgi:hypothetical protein